MGRVRGISYTLEVGGVESFGGAPRAPRSHVLSYSAFAGNGQQPPLAKRVPRRGEFRLTRRCDCEMVDPDLLEILVCPETKQAVMPADPELLDRINASMARGDVRNRAGHQVEEPLEEALVRSDGRLLFPVRDGIPVMLMDEAIILDT